MARIIDEVAVRVKSEAAGLAGEMQRDIDQAVDRAAAGSRGRNVSVLPDVDPGVRDAEVKIRAGLDRIAAGFTSAWGRMADGARGAFASAQGAAERVLETVRTRIEGLRSAWDAGIVQPLTRATDRVRSTWAAAIQSMQDAASRGFGRVAQALEPIATRARAVTDRISGYWRTTSNYARASFNIASEAATSAYGRIAARAAEATGAITRGWDGAASGAGRHRTQVELTGGVMERVGAVGRRVFEGLGTAIDRGGRGFTRAREGATSLLGKLGDVGGEIAGKLGPAFSTLGSVGGTVLSGLTSSATLLSVAIIAGVGALGGAVVAAPALLAGLAAPIGAIALGMDGIKRAAQAAKPALDQLKTAVSSSFEKSLLPAMQGIAQIIPKLTVGFQSVASALGGTATQMVNVVNTGPGIAVLQGLLQNVTLAIQAMQPGLVAGTQAFLRLTQIAGPAIQQLGAALGGIAQEWANAINRMADTGILQQALDGLVQVVRSIGPLFGQLLEVIGRLAAALGGPLASVIDAISNGLKASQPAITAFGQALGTIFSALAPVIQALLPLFFQLVQILAQALAPVIAALAPVLTTVANAFSQALAPVLPQLSAAFQRLGDALGPVAQALGGALADAVKALVPVLPVLVDAAVQLVDPFLQIVKAVIPLIPPLAQLAAAIIPPLVQIMLKLAQPVTDLAVAALPPLVDILVKVIQVATDVLVPIVNFAARAPSMGDAARGIGDAFRSVGDAIGAVIGFFRDLPGKIGQALSDLGSFIAQKAKEAWDGLVRSAKEGLDRAIEDVRTFPQRVAFALGYLAGMVFNAAKAAWRFLSETLPEFIDKAIAYVQALPGRIGAYLSQLATDVGNWARRTWDGFYQRTKELGQQALDWIRQVPGRVGSFLSSLPGLVRDAASRAFTAFLERIRTLGQQALDFVRSIPERVRSFFSNAGTWLLDAGRQIIQGLINGLKNAAQAVFDYIADLGRRVVAGFKAATGIASPSRAFMEAGGFLMDGLRLGIERGQDAVMRTLQGLGERIVATTRSMMAQASASIASSGMASAAQEVLNRLTAGGQVFEDLSFRGMSDNLRRFNDDLAGVLERFGSDGSRAGMIGALNRYLASLKAATSQVVATVNSTVRPNSSGGGSRPSAPSPTIAVRDTGQAGPAVGSGQIATRADLDGISDAVKQGVYDAVAQSIEPISNTGLARLVKKGNQEDGRL